MTSLADQQRYYFSTVKNSATANCKAYPGTDKETAENGSQEFIRGYIRIVDKGKTYRQSRDRQGAFQGKHPANLAIAKSNEREIDKQDKDRQRIAKHIGQ